MSKVRLTDSAIAKAKREAEECGARIELGDDDQRWLRLRVTENGVMSWTLLCKDSVGRTRRFMLGSYPGLGLSGARAKARTLRERVRDGYDPVHEGRLARNAQRAARAEMEWRSTALTMNGLFDLYEAKGGGRELKSWVPGRKRITSFFSEIMDGALGNLKLSDLQRVVDDAPSGSSAGFAVRTIRPVLKWGCAPGRGLCGEELAKIVVPAGGRLKRRQRVLDQSELERVWPALVRRAGEAHADCMRFILLTLMRRGEAENVRWKDVDLDAKTVRLAVTKNGREHVVPLSRQACEVLEGRQRFPYARKPDELVFPSDAGTVLGGWSRAQRAIHHASETKGWHRHDLRRTGATMLGEMGVEPYVIEAALNHVSIHSQIAATYNVARYREAVRGALARLGEKLASLGS